MIRVVVILGLLLAVYFGILWLRELEPESRRRSGKWALGAVIVAVLAVPLIRLGLHWHAVAGSTAFVALRRVLPWAFRAWPLARKVWQRRRRPGGDDEEKEG